MRMTVGGFEAYLIASVSPPRMRVEFVVDRLDDLLARVERLGAGGADRVLADAVAH